MGRFVIVTLDVQSTMAGRRPPVSRQLLWRDGRNGSLRRHEMLLPAAAKRNLRSLLPGGPVRDRNLPLIPWNCWCLERNLPPIPRNC